MDVEFKALVDSFTNLDNLKDAASVLSSFLKCHRKDINPKSPLLSPEACWSLLTQNAELYALLKDAHKKKDFSDFDTNVPRLPQVSWESYDELQTIKDLLDEVRRINDIGRIAKGEEPPFTIWRARHAEGAIAAHIEGLGIPNFKTHYPCTVMHRLGSFGLDPSVKGRLNNIFSSLHHTFLVNASGTGKSRLLLEGLCLNWGFYFTSAIDSSGLGSKDVYSVIHDLIPGSRGYSDMLFLSETTNVDEAMNANLRIAHRRLSETLLSRLLIFKIFLECATQGSRLTDEHKKRWLLVQLRPDILGVRDVFDSIQRRLMESNVTDDVVENAIVQTIQEISYIWDSDDCFYVLLDEANHAATTLSVSFSEDGEEYPVLKEIIRSWLRHLEHLRVSFVVAGTDVPPKYFETRANEWDKFTWCSDTGAFDNEADQRSYIQTILPPETLASVEGEALMERMWRWFRGRHRLTAAFLTILLQNDFKDLHSHLDEQMYAATKYFPDDGTEYSTGRTGFTDYHDITLEVLRHSNAIRTMMHEALIHAICSFDGYRNLGPNGVRLVTQSQGRFLDANMSHAVVDEPMVLTATAKWFTREPKSITNLEYFNSAINLTECRDIHRIDYVALYLALAVDGTRLLSDVLDFSRVPAWAKKSARLVVWKGNEGRVPSRYSDESPHQLVVTTDSLAGVLEWMNVNEHEVPFCSYTSDSCSTLVFALELGRGSRAWVVLQAPSEEGDTVDVEAVLPGLGTEAIFKPEEDTSAKESDEVLQALKKLPNLQSSLGPHGVLGVVASLKKKINLTSPTISDTNKQPVALLNIDLMERLSKERSQQELFDRLIYLFKRVGKRKDPPADEEPPDEEEPPPAPPKKGRKRKGKEKAAVEATEAPSGSGPSGSDAQPSTERRYNLRTSTLNKRRATK